jgi:hypothetical protein
MLAVDVIGFSGSYRVTEAQIQARYRLYAHLLEAFDMTGLPWWESHREDRGDGALVILPATTVPHLLCDPLAHHLRAVLRHANAHAEVPLRLRAAVHHGEVHHDAHGVTSPDLILLYRLLDSPAFKRTLTDDCDLGVIISDQLYRQAAASPYLSPSNYQRLTVSCKELRRASAWIWRP